MAVKAIVQLHERSTTSALEADLQLRELGLDAQTNSLIVSSELDSTKWHIITKEHTAPSLDNPLTLSSTLTVVGASTLAGLTATTGSFSSTLGVTGLATLSGGASIAGGTNAAGSIFKDATHGLALRGVTGSVDDFSIRSVDGTLILQNPTGTTGLTFPLTVTFTGSITLNSTISQSTTSGSPLTSIVTGTSGAWIFRADHFATLLIQSDQDNNSSSSDASIRFATDAGTLKGEIGLDNDAGDAIKIFAGGSAGFSGGGGISIASTGAVSTTGALTVAGNLTLSGLSSGRIPVISTSGLIIQDNLYWDATNDRLGIGSGASSPTDALSVWKTAVGSAVTISVYNQDTSNTSSHASLIASVGGTGGGNPRLVLAVVGGQQWATYLDNADGDSYKIETPLVTALKITQAGEVTISKSLAVSTETDLGTLSTSAGTPTSFDVSGKSALKLTVDPGSPFSSYVTFTNAVTGQIIFLRNTTTRSLYVTSGGSYIAPLSATLNAIIRYNGSTWAAYGVAA